MYFSVERQGQSFKYVMIKIDVIISGIASFFKKLEMTTQYSFIFHISSFSSTFFAGTMQSPKYEEKGKHRIKIGNNEQTDNHF